MNAGELYDAFRSDVQDLAEPFLWTKRDVYRYMNSAYSMYVRLIGGISDASSKHTKIPLLAGEGSSPASELILKVREARLLSTGRKIDVINHTDLQNYVVADYGNSRSAVTINGAQGPVKAIIIGVEDKTVYWLHVPQEDDEVNLLIYRLPADEIVTSSDTFPEVQREHHEAFLLWMKHMAYAKSDADTFNANLSESYKKQFEMYCSFAKHEADRKQSKTRQVGYGGI